MVHTPEGFGTVSPYFFVSEAERFVSFLKAAFDGREVGRHVRPDGRIANARIRIGTSTVMVSEATARYRPGQAACYIYVDNADQTMQQALEAGGTLEMEIADMPYGDRQGGIRDSHGNIWWVSQRLVQEPYSA